MTDLACRQHAHQLSNDKYIHLIWHETQGYIYPSSLYRQAFSPGPLEISFATELPGGQVLRMCWTVLPVDRARAGPNTDMSDTQLEHSPIKRHTTDHPALSLQQFLKTQADLDLSCFGASAAT